jgi:hypothetical protein
MNRPAVIFLMVFLHGRSVPIASHQTVTADRSHRSSNSRNRLLDAVPQQPALTGQLIAKPRIIPICIKNQWLELSIGGGDSQIAYSATAIQPNRPTSKLSTERCRT